MKTKAFFKITLLLLMLLMASEVAAGKEWPNQPITIVVGWAVGGPGDLYTRALAEDLTKRLGIPVLVENKLGGAGLISLNFVSKAKPDGYTLAQMSATAVTEKPFVMQVPFDPVKGFSYICQMFYFGFGFAVRTEAPWKTFPEFVEAAKKQPGKISVALGGLGGTQHVALAKLERKIPGLKLNVIPFKANVEAVTAVLGGHVDACFNTQEWKPYVDAGQLRLLAAPQKERWKEYPNVPTWLDLGYGIYAHSPAAYVAPPGLPEAIRNKLEQEFKKSLEYPGIRRVVKELSIQESYKPGKECYEELMKLYEENKAIIPKMGLSLK